MTHSAYLDIETTGISRHYADLTVVGLALERPDAYEVFQLIGDEISAARLLELLEEACVLYTYNGCVRKMWPELRTQSHSIVPPGSGMVV